MVDFCLLILVGEEMVVSDVASQMEKIKSEPRHCLTGIFRGNLAVPEMRRWFPNKMFPRNTFPKIGIFISSSE